jgi:O-antigen/teichoic acid export membrane protein
MQLIKNYFLKISLLLDSSLGAINFKTAIQLSLLKALGVVSSIIVIAVIIRELEVKNVGVYFLVFALAKIFSLIFSLGSFASIIPMHSSSNSDDVYHIVSLSIISSFIMAFLTIASINAIFFALPENISVSYWYIPYSSFLGAALIVQTNLFHIFSAKSQLIHATLLQEGTGRNIVMLCLVSFLMIFDDSLLGLRSIFTFSILASFILIFYGLINIKFYVNIFNTPKSLILKFFKLGFNFAPSTFLSNGSSHIIEILITFLFGPVTLAAIAIANRVCEAFLFFTHMINLYFVKASKIYFDGKLQDLNVLYKKCIAASFSSVLLIIFIFMLFGVPLANNLLRIDEIENAYFAIKLMFISTIGQSIAIFSLTLFRNIGRYKFVTALDSLNLILAILFLSIGFFYDDAMIAIAIIVVLRLIRQVISVAYFSYFLGHSRDY